MSTIIEFLKSLLNLKWIGFVICYLLGFLSGAILAKPTINIYTQAMELLSK